MLYEMASENVIETSNLTKVYGRNRGVESLSISVRRGEVFGFVGPNGAGKTTTIRLLLGLLRPCSGNIVLLGKDLRSCRKVLQEIGYLPGDLGLYGDLTANQYFDHLMRLRGISKRDGAYEWLEELKARLTVDFSRKINTYSKGMRQVTGLIQAFMHRPRLVLLDEPTNGLDPIMQESFYSLLEDERNRGMTVFFSSHILSEVNRVCCRIALIRSGRLEGVYDMERLREKAGRKVRFTVDGDTQGVWECISCLEGIHNPYRHERQIGFYYTGRMNILLTALSALKVEDFLCEAPTVQEFFMRAFGGNSDG